MTLPEFLNPTPEQVAELRQLFKEKLEKDAAKVPVGGFHEHDLKWVFEGDGWLIKFLENNDINMKDSLKQLWETIEWRKTSGINDIREDNIRMEYINDGLMYPRGRDVDGKTVFIFKSSKSCYLPKPSIGYGTLITKTSASTSTKTTCKSAGVARMTTCLSSSRKPGNRWSYR